MAEQELVVPLRPRRPRAVAAPGLSQDVRPGRYPLAEDDVLCDAFEIADWMPQIYARDVGWTRTAAPWVMQTLTSCIFIPTITASPAGRADRGRPCQDHARRPKGDRTPDGMKNEITNSNYPHEGRKSAPAQTR
jgi:hypothetical protein